MIITVDEVQDILRITDTDLYQSIRTQIPSVQDFILRYLKNHFLSLDTWFVSSGVSFTKTTKTIADSESSFVTSYFDNGMDIEVRNSKNNDGVFEIKTVAAGSAVLIDDMELVDEDADSAVQITRVKFPKALKVPMAKMIGFNLGITSYNTDDNLYSGEGGYPDQLIKELSPFRKTRLR